MISFFWGLAGKQVALQNVRSTKTTIQVTPCFPVKTTNDFLVFFVEIQLKYNGSFVLSF